MNKIVVLGSSNTDLVVRTGRMPLPGETLLGEQFMMTAGGKGANQAVAVARLGDGVTFIAKVGRDMFGDSSVAGYEKEGIDTRTVLRDDTAPSGIAVITVDAQAENSIVVVPGANNNLSKADVDALRRDIESAQFLLMQLETPVEVVAHAAAMARKAGVKVILNPAPAAELPAELLDGLYIITPNRTEGQMLTGIEISDWESAERAAQSLVGKGVQNVVITLGSQGALVCDGKNFERILARKVKAVDTTAAGDTFNGAMCVALSEGATLSDACGSLRALRPSPSPAWALRRRFPTAKSWTARSNFSADRVSRIQCTFPPSRMQSRTRPSPPETEKATYQQTT